MSRAHFMLLAACACTALLAQASAYAETRLTEKTAQSIDQPCTCSIEEDDDGKMRCENRITNADGKDGKDNSAPNSGNGGKGGVIKGAKSCDGTVSANGGNGGNKNSGRRSGNGGAGGKISF